jgi:hypothetical protein
MGIVNKHQENKKKHFNLFGYFSGGYCLTSQFKRYVEITFVRIVGMICYY